MDNSTHDMSEKLIQYLDGELPAAEKAEFEKQLAQNKQLKEELDNMVLARKAVRAYGLKRQVAGIHEEMMAEMQPPVKNMKNSRRVIAYTLAVAATVLLVFVAWNLFAPATVSAGKLFADNYRTYELTTTRDGSTESPIEKAYREKNYQLVTTLADTSVSIKNAFLDAMSNIELGNNLRAIDKLVTIQRQNQNAGTNILKDETEYYLALLYLRIKHYIPSLNLMNKIHDDPSHLYHERISDKLLHDVRKMASTEKPDLNKLP